MTENAARISDEQLVAYLDGELDAAQRQAVETALQRDASLKAHAGELDAAWQLLDRLEPPTLERDLTSSIMARATQQPGRPAPARIARWLRPVAAAAAVAVVAAGLYLTTTRHEATPPGSPTDATPVASADQEVIDNLHIIRNYDVLEHYDVLLALAEIQQQDAAHGDREIIQ